MPKKKPEREVATPQEVLTLAQYRSLRPGEIFFLSEQFAALERRVADLDRELMLKRDDHEERLRDASVNVSMEDNSTLRVAFPGSHAVRIPIGSLTMHDKAISMEALLRILRERSGRRTTVGMGGAPVQYDIKEILRTIKTDQVKKITKETKADRVKAKLLEIGLDIDNLEIPDEG